MNHEERELRCSGRDFGIGPKRLLVDHYLVVAEETVKEFWIQKTSLVTA